MQWLYLSQKDDVLVKRERMAGREARWTCPGVQEFRSSGVQEFRSSGVQEFRSSGVQEFRSSGVQREWTSKIARKSGA
jgi:hypothetical protein